MVPLERSGQVDQLINLLFDFAEGLEAAIGWMEVRDKHKDGSVETYEASIELPAEKAVRKAAQWLARLAGTGTAAVQRQVRNKGQEQFLIMVAW